MSLAANLVNSFHQRRMGLNTLFVKITQGQDRKSDSEVFENIEKKAAPSNKSSLMRNSTSKREEKVNDMTYEEDNVKQPLFRTVVGEVDKEFKNHLVEA